MKKIVSLILVLMMACLMIPSMAEEDYSGVWYLVEVAGMNPADLGISMSITLNPDGTASAGMSQGDESQESSGTWALEGEQVIVTIDGDAQSFDIVDGTLQADMGGGTMGTFSRDGEGAAPAIEIADVNPDAQAEDFNGTWKCVYMGVEAVTINMESALSMGQVDEIPMLSFQDGKATITGGDIASLFGEEGMEMNFADGAYSYVIEIGEASMGIYLNILQDGMLQLKLSIGQDISMYFTKAE